ncbi:hypothetical protein C1645_760664 [Glomus cerebriforme]|uniref:Uncharacterized protein n=1 Tax=Glomus cerebriforme TaxID=658196 RepID=A0A397TB90_9GLOM|nr:hypothetical protein C1645_760664 [Glomus cerebriforme]
MYKVKAIYFISNLDNITNIHDLKNNIQVDDSNSLLRKVLILKNESMTFPKLSNIWWENIKYYVAWRIYIKDLPSKDCSLNFVVRIGNGEDSYKKEHILEYEELSKLFGLSWIEYMLPLKLESDSLNWIEPSIEMKNGLIMKLDYIRFMPFEKDTIYLPKIDCLPIYKLHPNVPKAFENQYFQKKEVENLLELNSFIDYL